MKIKYNSLFPFKKYTAIMFFGVILARKEHRPLTIRTINHEQIHRAQAKEYRFYVRYYYVYIRQILKYGYRNSPMEQEAYDNDRNLNYLYQRQPFAWRQYTV